MSQARSRALGAVALATLIGAVTAVAATALLDTGRWEQAVIGLTDESEWPFHDVHLTTLAGQLDDPDLVDRVRVAEGLSSNEEIVVQLDRERQAGNGTLTVSARASSSEVAARMANGVAEEMISSAPSDTPVRLLDRAGPVTTRASTAGIALSGAGVGALVGLIVWAPFSMPRRDDAAA